MEAQDVNFRTQIAEELTRQELIDRLCEYHESVELKQIIKNIKEMNPYPVDIFPEPSDKEWQSIGKFLLEHGMNPDRIFAKWGRMVWNNCVNCMEDYLGE